MSATDNVIVAAFNERDRRCVIGPLWQYDYGQILKFEGIELPALYEVHFANNPRGSAKVAFGTENGVPIPDEFLTSGASVFAWLFLHTGQDDGETEYQVEIVVRRRAKASAEEPTPPEHDTITELIAEMTVASEGARTAKEQAVAAAESASENRNAADEAATLARSYAEGGTGTRNGEDADNAKYYAEQAAQTVGSALQGIETAKDEALSEINDGLRDIAEAKEEVTSEINAGLQEISDAETAAVAQIEQHESTVLSYKNAAIAAKQGAETAKAGAEDARDAAQRYASQAETAIHEAMYINFEIEDGDLVMYKTSNVTSIDFGLEEGDLVFYAIRNY